MKTTLLLGAAFSLLTASEFAADLAIPPPAAPPPRPFAWTGCYGGIHAGGAIERGDVTGAQFGCDYQFYSNLVLGVEGAVSGSTMKSSTTVAFPAGFAGDSGVVTTKTDFIPSVTARFGYAFDRVLLYAKG